MYAKPVKELKIDNFKVSKQHYAEREKYKIRVKIWAREFMVIISVTVFV